MSRHDITQKQFKENRKLKRLYVRWIMGDCCDVKVDLTFAEPVNSILGDALAKRFWDKMDDKIFGRSLRETGTNLIRHVVQETGALGDNIHYHCVTKTPSHITRNDYIKLLEETWQQMRDKNQSYGMTQYCRFEEIGNAWTAVQYMCKNLIESEFYNYDVSCSRSGHKTCEMHNTPD